jgi:hypothetical protein
MPSAWNGQQDFRQNNAVQVAGLNRIRFCAAVRFLAWVSGLGIRCYVSVLFDQLVLPPASCRA